MKSKHVLGGSALLGASACFLWLLFGQTGQQLEPAQISVDTVYETADAVSDDLWVILLPGADRETPVDVAETPFEREAGNILLVNVADTGMAIDEEFEAAIRGAIDGTPSGLVALQTYFDKVGGDEVVLTSRATAVIDGLRFSDIAGSFTALAEATTNVFNAASTALWSSYVMPAHFDQSFSLPFGAFGYDFGGTLNDDGSRDQPYSDFVRVSPDSDFVTGDLSAVRTSRTGLLGDGINGIARFEAEIPNGEYQVFVLTSNHAGVTPQSVFGARTYVERDTPVRRVDLSKNHETHAQVLLTAFGLTSHIGAPTIVAASLDDAIDGYGLRMRAIVEDGIMQIRFAAGDVPPFISGIVIQAAEPILEARLAEVISAMLENAPAPMPTAGGDPGSEPHDFTGSSTGGSSTGGSSTGGSSSGGGATTSGGSSGGFWGFGFTGDTSGGGTTTGGTTTGGTTTGGTTTGGTTTGGTTTGGTTTGGTDPGPTIKSSGDIDGPDEIVADAGPDQTVYFGDDFTLDGLGSTLDGVPVEDYLGKDLVGLLAEWWFDMDQNGSFETLVSTDLVATLNSSIFSGTGLFDGILWVGYDDLQDYDLITIEVVPEPATMALLASGLAGIAVVRRRRRKKAD